MHCKDHNLDLDLVNSVYFAEIKFYFFFDKKRKEKKKRLIEHIYDPYMS